MPKRRKTIFNMAAVRHLDYVKLPFWSRDLYLHVILHLRSEFRINSPVSRRDVAKNDFQYGARPPYWIRKISIFVKRSSSEIEICIRVPNLIEIR